LLGEGTILKAERVIDAAIRTLERGDQRPALAEALTTRGVILARLKRTEQARATFAQAIETAEQSGDLEKAGLAALALIEELPEHLTEDELCECAWRALSAIHTARPNWTTFSLNETLRRHEGRFIQMALEDAGGSVTKAAGLLGLPGHQSLNFILQNRHPELMNARTPIKPRRRRLFKLVNPQKQLEDSSKE
jgi:tetratricopeptide (TPR) repeat protein